MNPGENYAQQTLDQLVVQIKAGPTLNTLLHAAFTAVVGTVEKPRFPELIPLTHYLTHREPARYAEILHEVNANIDTIRFALTEHVPEGPGTLEGALDCAGKIMRDLVYKARLYPDNSEWLASFKAQGYVGTVGMCYLALEHALQDRPYDALLTLAAATAYYVTIDAVVTAQLTSIDGINPERQQYLRVKWLDVFYTAQIMQRKTVVTILNRENGVVEPADTLVQENPAPLTFVGENIIGDPTPRGASPYVVHVDDYPFLNIGDAHG